MAAMLKRIALVAIATLVVIAAANVLARILRPKAEPEGAVELQPAPRVAETFVRDPAGVILPKASVNAFILPATIVDHPDPIRRSGEFSGRFYAAFETSWFQPSDRNELWFLLGPASGKLWAFWESDRTIPYGPDHPDFDPNDPRPMEDWFWPYVCVETRVRGTWESRGAESIYEGMISVEDVLEATLVDLPVDECVPAHLNPRRSR